MKRKILNVLLVLSLMLALATTALAQEGVDRYEGRELPESVAGLKLDEPIVISNPKLMALDSDLVGAVGTQQVIIRLSADSGGSALAAGGDTDAAKLVARQQQDAFLNRLRQIDPNTRVLGQVQMVLNAVFVEADAQALVRLQKTRM